MGEEGDSNRHTGGDIDQILLPILRTSLLISWRTSLGSEVLIQPRRQLVLVSLSLSLSLSLCICKSRLRLFEHRIAVRSPRMPMFLHLKIGKSFLSLSFKTKTDLNHKVIVIMFPSLVFSSWGLWWSRSLLLNIIVPLPAT